MYTHCLIYELFDTSRSKIGFSIIKKVGNVLGPGAVVMLGDGEKRSPGGELVGAIEVDDGIGQAIFSRKLLDPGSAWGCVVEVSWP